MKKYKCDSQEDDLAVDVWSEGEGRGEGLLAEQAVTVVQRCLLTVLPELLLPRGESLDVHELGASTQRIHPRWHYRLDLQAAALHTGGGMSNYNIRHEVNFILMKPQKSASNGFNNIY